MARSKRREPRRIGAPVRVPHKVTQGHKKPSRQQLRADARKRDAQ